MGWKSFFFTNFGTHINDGSDTVGSATALTLPIGRRFVTVIGTTGIASISTTAPTLPVGSVVTLLFTGALTVSKGNNVKINSNFITTGTATDTLTLYFDGTNYIELSRSAN